MEDVKGLANIGIRTSAGPHHVYASGPSEKERQAHPGWPAVSVRTGLGGAIAVSGAFWPPETKSDIERVANVQSHAREDTSVQCTSGQDKISQEESRRWATRSQSWPLWAVESLWKGGRE